jgi:RecA-family ATPase
MKKVRGAGPELELKFNALIVSEEDIEIWAEGLLDELYKRLSSDFKPDLSDPKNLKRRILAEVNKIVSDKILDAIKEKGSSTVVIIKDKLPNGYLCDIVTGSYFYVLIIDILNKVLSESLLGTAVEESEPNA